MNIDLRGASATRPEKSRQQAALVAEQIAHELEEDIAIGLLHPRERLVEDSLMDRFDVKRHIVRSALASLETRGAVERRANVGALVRSFTAQDVRDLYDVRELLEAACARAIVEPVSATELRRVQKALHEHEQAVDDRDRRAALRANLAFHDALFDLCPNRILVEAVRRHARMASPIRSITVVNDHLLLRARDEHRAMVQALQAGNTKGLVHLCAQHLQPSRDAYLNLLEVQRQPPGE